MKLALLPLLAGIALAQPTLTVTGPSSPVAPGSTVNLSVTLAGSSGANIAGLQATIIAPNSTSVTAGAAATAAQKTVASGFSPASANLKWLLWGMNSNIFADGVVAQMQFTLPALPASGTVDAQQISTQLSGIVAASNTGSPVPITAGAPYTLSILSPCDINADGVVDSKDALLVIAAILGGGGSVPDLNGDGVINEIDLQRVVDAGVPGGHCRVGM